jgi:hypothetical protein
MKRILSITIETMPDEDPDTSWIGSYCDRFEQGVIVCQFGEFWERLSEEQRKEIYPKGRKYRCFAPYAGGEVAGTENAYKYGLQDWERMRTLTDGFWQVIGLRATAKVQMHPHGPIQTITSGGLWGIESDSDKTYLESVKQAQLSELHEELKALGFSQRRIEAIEVKEND